MGAEGLGWPWGVRAVGLAGGPVFGGRTPVADTGVPGGGARARVAGLERGVVGRFMAADSV